MPEIKANIPLPTTLLDIGTVPTKQITLAVLDLGDMAVETLMTIAERIRRALQ